MSACNVLGVDLSSHAIDLVLLDENADRASWTRIPLEGATAFERARDVAAKMPRPGWYEEHGVYLASIERPFSASRNDVVRLVEGCVLAAIPRGIETWECSPQSWKAHIGFKGKGKPALTDFPDGTRIQYATGEVIVQDALDALGCALWGRDTNAAIVALALAGAA